MSSTVLKHLTEMLVEANHQYNALRTHHESAMTVWQLRYHTLYSHYMTLQNRLLCEDCRLRLDREPDGGCVEFCSACTD